MAKKQTGKKRGRPRKAVSLTLAQAVHTVLNVYGNGKLVQDRAVAALWKLLPRSEKDQLGKVQAWQALKAAFSRSGHSITSASERGQRDLFGLKAAYALGTPGERIVKKTVLLTKFEFERAIAVRGDQVDKDTNSLNAMKAALAAVSPFWTDATMTFGEVCRLYQEHRASGAA